MAGHLARYLPLETATKREIERLDPDKISEMAAQVEQRISCLGEEFPSLLTASILNLIR